MALPRQAVMVALVVGALVACSGDGGDQPTPPASSGQVTTSGPPTPPATSPGASQQVPTSSDLVGYLVVPADLGVDWSQWEGFAAWPDGAPGVIPDDQRLLLPRLPMCPGAGAQTVELAANLQWQAFTQLHQATPDQFANMVVVQQLLLADEPDKTAATFAALRDGLTSCLSENLPAADWEIGLRRRSRFRRSATNGSPSAVPVSKRVKRGATAGSSWSATVRCSCSSRWTRS